MEEARRNAGVQSSREEEHDILKARRQTSSRGSDDSGKNRDPEDPERSEGSATGQGKMEEDDWLSMIQKPFLPGVEQRCFEYFSIAGTVTAAVL